MRACSKKSNKGFSLVELIIVVAIMAVLVGVLAPAYLGYVEKTRAGMDETAAEEIRRATETIVLSGTYEVTEEVLVTFSSAGIEVTDADYAEDLEKELIDLFGDLTTKVPKSKTYKDATYSVELTNAVNTTLTVAGSWN